MRGRVAGMPPVHKGRPQQLLQRGSGCHDGSIPRYPAGRLPYSRPRCLSLHIRPLGICSRFADRGLSAFVTRAPGMGPFLCPTRRFKIGHQTHDAAGQNECPAARRLNWKLQSPSGYLSAQDAPRFTGRGTNPGFARFHPRQTGRLSWRPVSFGAIFFAVVSIGQDGLLSRK
jgi:hypothetical protein